MKLIKTERNKRLTLRIDESLDKQIRQTAKHHQIKMSSLLRQVIHEGLKSLGATDTTTEV